MKGISVIRDTLTCFDSLWGDIDTIGSWEETRGIDDCMAAVPPGEPSYECYPY
jgi:hypothetical protein